MAFWRRHMPAGMLLRSGPDWHLDAGAAHTLEAYLEERAIDPADVDTLPIGLFLDYAEWFRQAKGMADGFPVLDEAFGASLPGLYLPGFAATRDLGPFFGFVKGTSAAATLIVNDLLARA